MGSGAAALAASLPDLADAARSGCLECSDEMKIHGDLSSPPSQRLVFVA